jgi:hypothetical protein
MLMLVLTSSPRVCQSYQQSDTIGASGAIDLITAGNAPTKFNWQCTAVQPPDLGVHGAQQPRMQLFHDHLNPLEHYECVHASVAAADTRRVALRGTWHVFAN